MLTIIQIEKGSGSDPLMAGPGRSQLTDVICPGQHFLSRGHL
jgi:hypothetical protein